MREEFVNENIRTEWRAADAAGPRHVLLVHGINDNGRVFRAMVRRLSEAGLTVHVAGYAPSDGSVGLDVLAWQIARFVEQRLQAVDRFDLVAFSMGGLVVRHYLQKLGGAARVDRLVTISTPHRGTLMAYFKRNRAGRQMRPRSAFLRELNADLETYRHIRWATVRTPFDLAIVPGGSATSPAAHNVSIRVALLRFMAADDRVIDAVLDFLHPAAAAPERSGMALALARRCAV